jgi:hypothetical protein
MILYRLEFMMRSKTIRGNGKVVWRKWSAERTFENHELARLPEEGGIVNFGTIDMKCTEVRDSFGLWEEDEEDLVWDNSIPVTICTFGPTNVRHWVGYVACLEDRNPEMLQRELLDTGFKLYIGYPCDDQEPSETPPPTIN